MPSVRQITATNGKRTLFADFQLRELATLFSKLQGDIQLLRLYWRNVKGLNPDSGFRLYLFMRGSKIVCAVTLSKLMLLLIYFINTNIMLYNLQIFLQFCLKMTASIFIQFRSVFRRQMASLVFCHVCRDAQRWRNWSLIDHSGFSLKPRQPAICQLSISLILKLLLVFVSYERWLVWRIKAVRLGSNLLTCSLCEISSQKAIKYIFADSHS